VAGTHGSMTLSRLALAVVISLRAVLVYGEVTTCATAELTWRELLPARLRELPRPTMPSAPAPGAELIREVPS
jgi:hypothetical protein